MSGQINFFYVSIFKKKTQFNCHFFVVFTANLALASDFAASFPVFEL